MFAISRRVVGGQGAGRPSSHDRSVKLRIHCIKMNRAVALVVLAVFGFHFSRFYMVADLTNFVCPHHVANLGSPAESSQHVGHEMGDGQAAPPASQPTDPDSGLRCCCRHALDGLITTLILDTPAEVASVPLPDGGATAMLATTLSFSENDPNPPFQPPRV